ncbi:uncharacterized protein [Linepithema humile]|uniref:uncharacterized protein n=1 Tax=Linepithema humile TaxID=83485 RepID=UPI00351F68AA
MLRYQLMSVVTTRWPITFIIFSLSNYGISRSIEPMAVQEKSVINLAGTRFIMDGIYIWVNGASWFDARISTGIDISGRRSFDDIRLISEIRIHILSKHPNICFPMIYSLTRCVRVNQIFVPPVVVRTFKRSEQSTLGH